MNITFGYSSLYNRDTIDNNFFWHNVNNFASEVLNSKHNILVFYGKDSNADIKGLEFIGKGQTKTICNLIIVISETKETVSVIKNAIKNMFEEMKCSGDFVIIPLDKEDLKELYYSNNPSIIFENHIKNELLNYQ